MTPNYDTQKNRDYWRFVYKTAVEVASWPAWKRGNDDTPDDSEPRRRLADLDAYEERCVWLTK